MISSIERTDLQDRLRAAAVKQAVQGTAAEGLSTCLLSQISNLAIHTSKHHTSAQHTSTSASHLQARDARNHKEVSGGGLLGHLLSSKYTEQAAAAASKLAAAKRPLIVEVQGSTAADKSVEAASHITSAAAPPADATLLVGIVDATSEQVHFGDKAINEHAIQTADSTCHTISYTQSHYRQQHQEHDPIMIGGTRSPSAVASADDSASGTPSIQV
jgi:hypothetical protein